MSNIKFSIIIPLFNKEFYIRNTINSVLAQSYNNFELIIVDDCSTDNSYNIVKNFDDVRIRLFRNDQNRGVGFTRNKGIELSTGDYIIFLDADDEFIHEDLLERLSIFIEKYKSQYIMLTRRYSDKTVKPNFESIRKYLRHTKDNDFYKIDDNVNVAILGNFPFGGSASAVVSSSLVKKHRFDLEEKRYEDWLFFLKIFLFTEPYYYKEEAVLINFDNNSLSRVISKNPLNHTPKLYLYLVHYGPAKLRKAFFWSWMNSGISKNITFSDAYKVYKKYSVEFIKNFTLNTFALNRMIRVQLKLLLFSFVNSVTKR